ncbi:MAG: DUF4136 domain-containing protein [Cyclobacteriaceae bacterium]
MKTYIPAHLLLVLCFCACTTARVERAYQESTDFSQYKTFNFVPSTGQQNENLLSNQIRIEEVKQLVAMQLNAIAFEESDDPDLLVNFGIVPSANTANAASGLVFTGVRDYALLAEDKSKTGDLKPGTVVIDLVDAQQKKMIWQGRGDKLIKPTKNEINSFEVQYAVKELLASFPGY